MPLFSLQWQLRGECRKYSAIILESAVNHLHDFMGLNYTLSGQLRNPGLLCNNPYSITAPHMKKLLFILLLTLTSLMSTTQASDNAEEIWIDVRTVAEYQQGHKKDAINIPHTAIGQRIKNITKNTAAKIHLYCAVGVRAGIAKATLQRMGYTNVINEGGLSDIQ